MNPISSTIEHPPGATGQTATAPLWSARRIWQINLGFLALGWLLLFNQERLEWSVDPAYAYGWLVPVLAGFLFWERWRTRPPSAAPAGRPWWLFAPALLLLAYLPVRVIQEANPDWVKINWIMAGLITGLSLSAIYGLSGWRGVLYCAFPVLFCFTALPWPVWIEDNLTKSLMHWNAGACAELLSLLGHPALAKGSVIQIGTVWVNVEEACSGIRSLQTAFMVSLFFGEFYRLTFGARGWLMLSSFVVAFVLNFGRTLTLTYLGGTAGNAVMERWHDTIGNLVMVLCLVALWLLAEYFRRRRGRPASPPAVAATAPPTPRRAPFPLWFALAGLLWLAGSEAANAAWYAYHERGLPTPVEWKPAWPSERPSFHRGAFAERTQTLLKYNEGEIASWRTDEGYQWEMYYLRWKPGRVSKFLAGAHYPTVCLSATGMRLVAETGTFTCQVGDLTIPFMTYLFDDNGRDVYVFHAIVEDNPSGYHDRIAYRQANSTERLRSVWRGERNLGQRVLGIALTGPLESREARAALQRMLRRIIVTAPVSLRHGTEDQG